MKDAEYVPDSKPLLRGIDLKRMKWHRVILLDRPDFTLVVFCNWFINRKKMQHTVINVINAHAVVVCWSLGDLKP
jgi:hypothetical protein